jgi:putative flippase GtrA
MSGLGSDAECGRFAGRSSNSKRRVHLTENAQLHPLLNRLVRLGNSNARMAGVTNAVMKNRREVVRFLKFAVVGGIGTVVDFSTLNLMHLAFGLPLVTANTISFCLAVISNFTWNRLWTFPESRQRSLWTQLGQFVAVNVVGLAINQAVFLSLNHYVFEPRLGPLGYNVAKAIAIIIVLFWNFAINRIWTYKGIH